MIGSSCRRVDVVAAAVASAPWAEAELGALADPFGLMAQVLYTGDLASYPSTASSSQANTWQDIANVLCP